MNFVEQEWTESAIILWTIECERLIMQEVSSNVYA